MTHQRSDQGRQNRRSLIRSWTRRGLAASVAVALGQSRLNNAAAASCANTQCYHDHFECQFRNGLRTGLGRYCRRYYAYDEAFNCTNQFCYGGACTVWADYSQTSCPPGALSPEPNENTAG